MNVSNAMRLAVPCTAAMIVAGCNLFDGSAKTKPVAVLGPDDPTTLQFGPVVSLAHPPPPLSGGTLAITRDGVTAVASDPDRDLVYVVDVAAGALTQTISLSAGDEPGRVAIDGSGRAHVALRGANALLTIDLATGTTVRRDTCIAPRGVAVEKAGTVVVACADGRIARFAAAGGDAIATAFLEPDLRDVLPRPDGTLVVSVFRHAALLLVKPDLKSSARWDTNGVTNLAWRAFDFAEPDGTRTTAMISQKPQQPGDTSAPNAYGGACGCGLVPTHVDVLLGSQSFGGLARRSYDFNAVLPVDGVIDESSIVIVAAGNGHSPGAPQLFILSREATSPDRGPAINPPSKDCLLTNDVTDLTTLTTPGQPIAVAIDGSRRLIVQSREPAALYVVGAERTRVMHTIGLSDVSREDTGHAIFHSNSGSEIACASCHAEGGEDSHTWSFDDLGDRRTPSLRGTVAGTAPYHWDGSQKDMADIMNHVFRDRMSGPQLDSAQIDAMNRWVSAIPAPSRMSSAADAAARGAAVFTAHGCDGCHSGAKHTNNQTVDVGTGGAFQVPSLVGVAWRSPYVHDGRYDTLEHRFEGNPGPHGGMTTTEIGDLVAFLQTL
jgi:hypothetical protein